MSPLLAFQHGASPTLTGDLLSLDPDPKAPSSEDKPSSRKLARARDYEPANSADHPVDLAYIQSINHAPAVTGQIYAIAQGK